MQCHRLLKWGRPLLTAAAAPAACSRRLLLPHTPAQAGGVFGVACSKNAAALRHYIIVTRCTRTYDVELHLPELSHNPSTNTHNTLAAEPCMSRTYAVRLAVDLGAVWPRPLQSIRTSNEAKRTSACVSGSCVQPAAPPSASDPSLAPCRPGVAASSHTVHHQQQDQPLDPAAAAPVPLCALLLHNAGRSSLGCCWSSAAAAAVWLQALLEMPSVSVMCLRALETR